MEYFRNIDGGEINISLAIKIGWFDVRRLCIGIRNTDNVAGHSRWS